jgi:3-hydroxybutyryl-CoA dehydrogenase
LNKVTVIGAGTMGHGIAQIAAVAGFTVALTDNVAAALPSAVERIRNNLKGGVARGKLAEEDADAAMAKIELASDLTEAVTDADLVIEAVVEDLQMKRDLFRTLDAIAPDNAILATNTSSLSVAAIATATKRPDWVLGMHFFNPVHIMKLVELVRHDQTGDEVVETAREVTVRMGKVPIVVRDCPGFASSRLGVVLGLEAMRMLEQDVASAEDIDKAMTLGYGHPMGPLRVSDLVGLDVRLAIAEYLHGELGDAHFEPPEILVKKVREGELGKKTGKGFYEWPTTKTS